MTAMRSYIKYPWAASPIVPWRVPQLCLSYGAPNDLPGGGTIGIVELGGGWTWDDTGRFCAASNLPMPKIMDVPVDQGAGNKPGDPADGEVALDIQVALGMYSVATGGQPANIRMYWANNDAGGITRAIMKATTDKIDVLSISWGAPEDQWGLPAAINLENAAAAATSAGIAVFAASGDNDSSDGETGLRNVDLPAGCPHVVGCGGTRRPHGASALVLETVWNNNPGKADGEGTGGGFSTFFGPQSWQAGAPIGPGRMVPDVSANADPQTGYWICVNGSWIVVGGTSAVAPLYAGMFAAFGKKPGWVSPRLWQNQLMFNDIIRGNNGAYRALPGPDACTGLGSPRIAKLATLFS